MNVYYTIFIFIAVLVSPQGQPQASEVSRLRFQGDGTSGFSFDTGELRGKLRASGRSKGLSSVVHLRSGVTLDSSMGLLSHYRVFTSNKRYGEAAWAWPSEAALLSDGAVSVRWPPAPERPFELRAVYRWADARTIDLETTVQALTNLSGFESFLASYFSEGFTNSLVLTQPGDGKSKRFMPVVSANGVWQAFPRDEHAVQMLRDGRWTHPPNPVDWVIMPPLASPLGYRQHQVSGLQAVLMSPRQDCFAILSPFETDKHRSMYLSLFGRDLKPGEIASARVRLVIAVGEGEETPEMLYARYLRDLAK